MQMFLVFKKIAEKMCCLIERKSKYERCETKMCEGLKRTLTNRLQFQSYWHTERDRYLY